MTKVLLVDDDDDCRQMFSLALRAAGFEVTTATNGERCVTLARDSAPDVILLDVAMPVMDGHEALRRLKADPLTKSIPTLAVTAIVSAHNAGELEAAGFDAVLLKPILPRVMIAAIQRVTAVSRP